MSYKVVRVSGVVVAFGPNEEWYEPGAAYVIEDAEPPPFPAPIADVTPRQIRMALSRTGLRAIVESAIAAGSQDLKDWYEFSTTFQRLQPLVVQMGIDLGQTPAQLDALWQLAASL
jgi:hypothetical protein